MSMSHCEEQREQETAEDTYRENLNHTNDEHREVQTQGGIVAKIDASRSSTDMTPEEKIAALEAYEAADPDYTGYISPGH